MLRRTDARRPGLTLIEIIVVIAIISILMLITVAMGQHVINANNRKATEAMLEALAAASDRYKIERGTWPWQETAAGYAVGGLPNGQTSRWEIELTRKLEPNGAVRIPFFEAGLPTLRETTLAHSRFGPAEPDGTATTTAVDANVGNYDTASGGYYRVFDQWGHRIFLELPTSVLGLTNQGMPIYHSPGPDGNFTIFTAAGVYTNSDDVFSHCGTD